MRRIFWTFMALWLCGLLVSSRAETYSLADGTSLNGDIITFDGIGVKFRLADGTYSERISWTKFSQAGLQQLATNPKIKPLVEPFMDIPLSERPKSADIKIKDVKRLELPPKQSLLGALFSSSVGFLALFLVYAANVYSGYEIAVFRARPKALVMGVAAVLPILGPIIFLALPMPENGTPVEAPVEGEPAAIAASGEVPVPAELHVAPGAWQAPAPSKPAAQVFQRGQFTFNRRFFETKFSGFFGPVRHGADKDRVLFIKTGGGQFVVERITRIAASDVHLEVVVGEVRQEVMVPFGDIHEIQLIPKDS